MQTKKTWIRTELPQLLLLLGMILAARSSFADHYYVPSGSMEYTLISGDRVFVDKTAYGLRLPFSSVEILPGKSVERGEVVIFDSPRSGDRLIKRIVGIGGDSITIKNGSLFVNGTALAQQDPNIEFFGKREVSLNLRDGGGPNIDRLEIPPGMVLSVGDHRGNSLDGRFFGLVPEDDVYGRAVAVYRRRDAGFTWLPL